MFGWYHDVPQYMRSYKRMLDEITNIANIKYDLKEMVESGKRISPSFLMEVRRRIFNLENTIGACIEDSIISSSSENDHESDNSSDMIFDMSEDILVKVRYDGNILSVFTPLTFDQKWNLSRIFRRHVAMALVKWEQENHTTIKSITTGKFLCMVIRNTMEYNMYTMNDNDNAELSNIINTVVRFLGTGDDVMTMHYAGRQHTVNSPEHVGMEIRFIPCDYIQAHPDEVGMMFTGL